MTNQTIEKQWCTYGGFLGPWNVGKVVKDYGDNVCIQYSEGQVYFPDCWDSDYVQRFHTIE